VTLWLGYDDAATWQILLDTTEADSAVLVTTRFTVLKDEHGWHAAVTLTLAAYPVDCCMAEAEQTAILVLSAVVDVSNTTRFGDLAEVDVTLTGGHCSATCTSGETECSGNSLTTTLRFCASVDGHIFLMEVTLTVRVPGAVCGTVRSTDTT